MSGLAITRSSRSADATRLTLSALLIGLVAAGATVGLVHAGSLKAVAGLIVFVGLFWFGTTRNPQLALALILLYLGLLDGYLKLATGSSAVTFVRDALLYAFAVGFLIRTVVQRVPLPAPPLSGWVIAFTLLVLVQLLNPNDGSLFHSIAGLRQNLEFVPLFWLTFAFVRTKKALRNLVYLMIFIAMANGIATIVQAHESTAQLAAWGPGYAERVNATGAFSAAGRTFYNSTTGQQFVRPFGLMSDSGTGGLVCAFALACIVAVATMPGRRRSTLIAAILAGSIALVGMVDSQGRSVIIAGVVIAVAYGAMTGNSRFRGRGMSVFIALGMAGLLYFGATKYLAGSGSRDSTLGASQILQTTSQSRGAALQTIPINIKNYPLGSGLGSGGPAAGQSGAPAAVNYVNAESEISLATLEAGIPGMLVIVGFTGFLLYLGVRRCPLEDDAETRYLLAGLIAPLGALLVLYWVSPLTTTTPTGPYLFGIGGLISYWLVERPRAARSRAAELPASRVPQALRAKESGAVVRA